MYSKNLCIQVLLVVCLLSVFISSSPVFAARWYEYYLDAEKAVESEDWTNAIELYKKAIKKQSKPAKGKRAYGMRKVDYYPYLKLGKAYLVIGDLKNVQKYCEQAKKKGVAPKAEVEECLTAASGTISAPAPTPIPQVPTPVPAPPTPVPPPPTPIPKDESPFLKVISEIPDETEHETIKVEGLATDDKGIEDIKVTVKKPGTEGVILTAALERKEEIFRANVQLDIGQNEITVEAIDTRGQREKQVFTVVRKSSREPTPQPTPQPMPVQVDERPAIILVSEIFAETEQEKLTIQGVATDDSGVRDVKVTVQNPKVEGLTVERAEKPQETQKNFKFSRNVSLGIGQNLVAIEVIDTQGQVARKEFTVVRNVAPTPTPVPDTPPTIIVIEIPATVEQETITIQIASTDDLGVKEVKIRVKKPEAGTRGLSLGEPTELVAEKPRSVQKEFELSKNIPLDPGKNEIIIEAIDTAGQKTQQVVTIFRKIPPQKREGEVYSVIIGIGDYQDERIPDLRFTEADAQGLYDVLTDPNYGGVPEDNVKLLLHKDATVSNIKRAIGTWLKRQAGEEDTVILYYAGHGAPEGDETYWVTYEADIDDLYATALSNNNVSDMFARIQSKRMITFLDACYSAATVSRSKGTRGMPTEIPWDKFKGEGRVTITASNGKQESLEDKEYGHGVFTYHLLQGLKGKADGKAGENQDGVVELDEIWNYVRDRVKEDARKRGNIQEPRNISPEGYSSGILLTYDASFFQQQDQAQEEIQHKQEIKKKQKKLAELYEQGDIKDEYFECALGMLDSGTPNKYLEKLLSGKMKPETFNRFFTCESQ